ncbi:MAG: CopG family transcriptional regulator [Oscillospiraceae bacterium]|nr:CopG family transcriptional regulator [Oscillospiraceae bacterium]
MGTNEPTEKLNVTRKTQPVMFSIRVDKTIVDYYDKLATETNRSRNELIAMALEFAMDKIEIK